MRLIQVLDADLAPLALFQAPDKTVDPERLVEEAFELAKNNEDNEHTDEVVDQAADILAAQNITRMYVTEVNTNL